MVHSRVFPLLLLLLTSCAVVSQAPQPSELFRQGIVIGSGTFVLALETEILAFTGTPATVQRYSLDGVRLDTELIATIPQSSAGYQVDLATPVYVGDVLDYILVHVNDQCSGTSPEICTVRLMRYYPGEGFTWDADIVYSGEPATVGTPLSYQKPAVSPDGQTILQPLSNSSIEGINGTSGESLWITATDAIPNGGVFVGSDAAAFSYRGSGQVVLISAADGSVLDEYTPPLPCTVTASDPTVDACNNVFNTPLVTTDALYVVDDLAGVTKLDLSDLAAGPLWNIPFGTANSGGQQRTLSQCALSADGAAVFAYAETEYAALSVADGEVLWTFSSPEFATSRQPSAFRVQSDGTFVYALSIGQLRSMGAPDGSLYWETSADLDLSVYDLSADGLSLYAFNASGRTLFGLQASLPSLAPSGSSMPSLAPSISPTESSAPSGVPTTSEAPSTAPSMVDISSAPSVMASAEPSTSVSPSSSDMPTMTMQPSSIPTATITTSTSPSTIPSIAVSGVPTLSDSPTSAESASPSQAPSKELILPPPSDSPTPLPTPAPTPAPTARPTPFPVFNNLTPFPTSGAQSSWYSVASCGVIAFLSSLVF